MKLASVIVHGHVAPAIVVDGGAIVGSTGDGWPRTLAEVVADGAHWLPIMAALARDVAPTPDPVFAAPLSRPGKIVAVGLNYADHATEGKVDLPTEPLLFTKFTSSIIGPGEAITWDPALTDAVDYEAELAVVIGRRAKGVSVEAALDHVFGYTCLNDVSARDLQFADGQWVRAKSLDTFCPLGPWIVTADELPDPTDLLVECVVSGEVLQSASTADMVFPVAQLISRISRAITLEPGDVIASGTPPGVGYFREPRRVLRDGDEVVVRIAGVGELRNPVRVP